MEGQLHPSRVKPGHGAGPALCLVRGWFSMFAVCSSSLSPGSLGQGRVTAAQEQGTAPASPTSTPAVHVVPDPPAGWRVGGGESLTGNTAVFPTLLQGPLPTSCLRSDATFPVRPPHLSSLSPLYFLPNHLPPNILHVLLITFV